MQPTLHEITNGLRFFLLFLQRSKISLLSLSPPFLLSLSLSPPLFLRFSQFFLATFTPRFARLWHRVRWIFLDSQRESTATTIRLVTRPVPSFLTPARVHAGKYAGRPCTLIHSRPFYRPMGSIGIWSEYTQMAFFLSFYFFIFFLSFFLTELWWKAGRREVISEGILIGSPRVEATR